MMCFVYLTINPLKYSRYYMTLFHYWGRIISAFLLLLQVNTSSAEQNIASRIDLPYPQLQQLERLNFKMLGLLQIQDDAGVDFPLMEFSGLGWDEDEKSLIILSDRGYFIHTRPVFSGEQLNKLKLLSYHHLKNKNGKKLNADFSDSEGLALINANNNIKGDTELIVSFERHPRIIQYKSNGDFISKHPINNELHKIEHYSGKNKALEAITLHKDFNMITGPERPLKKANQNVLSLHTLQKGSWEFVPDNEHYGSLVGLTTLPDNRIIALERIFASVFSGISNVIHVLHLDTDSIKQKQLVKLKSTEHHFNDNFEGIAWHKENRFFMISDDNNNVLQRSLLVYFEIPNLNEQQ